MDNMILYLSKNNDSSNNNSISLEYNPKDRIKNLKERLKKDYGIPLYCQKLYYKGNELSDDKKFSDYDIKHFKYGATYISYLDLFNLNELKIIITIRDTEFDYILKASDSILNLKEVVSKNLNIPVDKMIILHSNTLLKDKDLIENFIPNLTFKVEFKDNEKIQINIINSNQNEIIYVNKFSYTDDIFNILNKDYHYKLKYNNKYIYFGKFLFEYNLKNGDNIELIKKPNMIKLIIHLGTENDKTAIVDLEEQIYTLLDIINIKDKTIKFIFYGRTYSLASTLTFKDIGMTKDTSIFLIKQSIAGSDKNLN